MTVYRASAGSGKTFTLAIRYIEMLIDDPTSYRKTLAVTFTNKATEEMKTRILSQLYGLSQGLSDSDSYMERIISDMKCTKEHVRKQADIALHLMLHDYSSFSVETIDAFFQRVLRNLAHELELNANLKVELNNNEVEEMAVDKLISELRDNDVVLNWIIQYIEQKMEEDSNWNVIDSIKDFGKKIFTQEYKDNADELSVLFKVEGFFKNYQDSLRKIISDGDKNMEDLANEFYALLDKNGFTIDNLSYKANGPASYFIKLKNHDYLDSSIVGTRVNSAMKSPSGWYSGKEKNEVLKKLAAESLTPLLNRAEDERKKWVKKVASAKVVLANLNELRLLNNIEQEVRNLNAEANRLLLDDTQNLLAKLMKDSDAPFVFEKIGGRILNIMIDEFQDTSTVQWSNFKKLILECMSQSNSQNLVVGDVKQSIYRWRNGDWGLLNNIGEDSDLNDKGIKLDKLDTNYRSDTRIIRFNNEFFIEAAAKEASNLKAECEKDSKHEHQYDSLTQIYQRDLVEQHFPKDKEEAGYVDIRLLPSAEYNEECLNLTRDHIETLIENGADESDIAIIVRDNSNINKLATWLQEQMPEHSFISDEAFRLDASMALNIIIDAMRVLSRPYDKLTRAQLAKEYQMYIHNENVHTIFFSQEEGINRYLPVEFVSRSSDLLTLPLIDLVEEIIKIFSLQTLSGDAAYINAFFDQLNNFTRNNTPDLDLFIEKWDESLYKKTVKGGDLKGIRLITIHKSKGLEFNHVLMPYCDWELDKGSTLWCKTDVEPYSELPIVPVSSKRLKDTIYEDYYHDERLQVCIDNLNMLYVAFTRAGKSLFVIGKNSASKEGVSTSHRSGLIQSLLVHMSNTLEGATLEGDITKKEEAIRFEYGTLAVSSHTSKDNDKKAANVFLQNRDDIPVEMEASIGALEFRQSNRSKDFVTDGEGDENNQHYITQGTVMHYVLSLIHDSRDVEHVLNSFVQEGIVSDTDENLNRNTLSKLISKRIEDNQHEVVNSWFSPDVEVFNECSILSFDKQTGMPVELRPDRVVKNGEKMTVIDFKFGTQRDEYKRQVRQYMQLLKEMGYEHVDGYLWYVYKNEVVSVNL